MPKSKVWKRSDTCVYERAESQGDKKGAKKCQDNKGAEGYQDMKEAED
jgi:hypothetical protein